jgi:threonine/homoserine/homoserine lactone efflux protein
LPETLDLVLRGIIAGIAISAPVGPVNVLCVSRTLWAGRKGGLLSGLGAAVGDTIYGAIAAFSISFVIQFLVRELHWIRLIGGSLLIAIGILYFRKKPQPLSREPECSGHSEFITAFLLNLTNPTVVLSFLGVLAALRMTESKAWWLNLLVVSGIFAGSMLWWTLLVFTTNRYRESFDGRMLLWMNRVAGIAIGVFGVVTLILSRAKR